VFYVVSLLYILCVYCESDVYPVFYVVLCSKTKLCDKSRKIWRSSRPEQTNPTYVSSLVLISLLW